MNGRIVLGLLVFSSTMHGIPEQPAPEVKRSTISEKIKNGLKEIDAKVITIVALGTILITQFINHRQVEKLQHGLGTTNATVNSGFTKLYDTQQRLHRQQMNKLQLSALNTLNEVQESLEKIVKGDLQLVTEQTKGTQTQAIAIEEVIRKIRNCHVSDSTAVVDGLHNPDVIDMDAASKTLREILEQVSSGLLKISSPLGESRVEQMTPGDLIDKLKQGISQLSPRRHSA